MKQELVVRCVTRTEELETAGVTLDPRPEEPQPEGQIRGFWLRRGRQEAFEFVVGGLYKVTIEGPVPEPAP